MSIEREFQSLPTDKDRTFGPGEDREVEIAFLLENGQPGDGRYLDLLIDRYGEEIYRLTGLLLVPQGRSGLSEAEIMARTAEIFATAVQNLDRFQGEASVRNWLYRHAVQVWRAALRERRAQKPVLAGQAVGERDGAQAQLGTLIEDLPEAERLALLFHYATELETEEAADVLGWRPKAMHDRLHSARRKLLAGSKVGGRSSIQKHARIRRQIEAGLEDSDAASAGMEVLEEHLTACPDCQAYRKDLQDLETRIHASLEQSWPQPALQPGEIETLKESARTTLAQSLPTRRAQFPFRQAAWVALISLTLFAAAWSLYYAGLDRGWTEEPPQQVPPSQPTPTILPTPIQIAERQIVKPDSIDAAQTGEENGDRRPDVIYSIEPSLSGDGRWMAFTSSASFSPDEAWQGAQELYLYDHDRRSLEKLPTGERDPAYRWRQAPSVSGDGRWVAYLSFQEEPASGAPWRGGVLGLYLYDRVSGRTERIDQGHDGSPASGDSFSPALSSDGRWLSFWSTASNLVPGDDESCSERNNQAGCLDIFIYDTVERAISRVPVGRQRDLAWATDPVEISTDGRWLSLTIYASDRTARELEQSRAMQAYAYDRELSRFFPVDLASDGTPGDGISFTPSLSSNGRYIAFISRSRNLVPGDTGDRANVFVHNLQTGETELASAPDEGISGFEFPGRQYPSNEGWGNDVSLSADGRFVAFLSGLSNANECRPRDELGCNGVYLRDRETGEIWQVAGPKAGSLYLFPDLSEDGRWLSYTENDVDCQPSATQPPACAEVWLYDRESDWTFAVTKGKYALPDYLWSATYRRGGFDSAISSLALSQDEGSLAVGFRDGQIELRRSSYLDKFASLESTSGAGIASLAFSPAGDRLAAGLEDGRVDVWQLPERKILYTLDGQPGRVLQVTFSHDGQRVLVRTRQEIWLWQLRNGFFVQTSRLEHPTGSVRAAVLFPSGDLIATADSDNTVWLRAMPSGDPLLRLAGQTGGILETVAVSQSGRLLAAGWKGGAIDLWQIEEQADGIPQASYLKTLWYPEDAHQLAFSTDGAILVSRSLEGNLRLWRVLTGDLIISPQPPQPAVPEASTSSPRFSGIFSIGRRSLAAALNSSEIILWHGSASLATPRFFKHELSDGFYPLDGRRVERNFQPGQGYTYSGWEVRYRSLHRLDTDLSFAARVPARLPPGFTFEWSQFAPGGAVVLYYPYSQDPGGEPSGGLYIREMRYTDQLPLYPIGASASIEPVEIGGVTGEYVRGEWVSYLDDSEASTDEERKLFWVWESDAPSQRLRYRDGDLEVSISYRPFDENGQASQYLTQADLVAIAESMVDLDLALRSDEHLSVELLKSEHTCAAIAEPENGITGYSIQLYDSFDGCPLIFKGHPIVDSQAEQRLPFAETDLNCDGLVERLEVLPVASGREPDHFFDIVVRTPSLTGLYQDAWRLPVAGEQGELQARAELLSLRRCERFLAVNTRSGAGAGLKVYRWDGTEMVLVLQQSGQVGAEVSPGRPSAELVIHSLIPVLPDGSCTHLTQRFAWAGEGFVKAGESSTDGLGCGAGGG